VILQTSHFLEFIGWTARVATAAPGPGSGRLAVFQEEETRELFAVNWSRPYNVFLCDSINAKEIIKSMKREGRNAFVIKSSKEDF
jgi:hypothetical protein